ncbi:MAG: anhydro-N-acetylmuramic acid kinase [Planctomycetota bacterium]
MTEPRLFIGLHCDRADHGVDAVIAEVAPSESDQAPHARQRRCLTHRMPDDLRDALRAPSDAPGAPPPDELDLRLGATMGQAAIRLMREAGIAPGQVAAIGIGPLRRGPGPRGELGLPEAVAQTAHLPAVGRFGAADVAAGGHGGTVTAWPIWRLLRGERLSRVVLHLGAICSLTFVGGDAAAEEVVAYDVGPGTEALDAVARRALGAPGDPDGALAARGRPNPAMVHELLVQPYLTQSPPKTATAAQWGGVWLDRLEMRSEKHACAAADLPATVTEAVAAAAARSVEGLTERPHEVILAGRGAGNIHLAMRIRDRLSPSSTYTIERYGVAVTGLPALCLATLAAARLDGVAAHCPCASGAARAVVLGGVCLP